MNELHEQDKDLVEELNLRSFVRLIGYNEVGEPVEFVYDSDDETYSWHIGGEFLQQASDRSIERFASYFNQCPQ